ncbi:MAG: 3-hydroxyisobutyrate dehydrogenase [Gammaproteobacteria bacterium]|nr:MAG: 3-hydroxyisobutyrate dehydrogenase [Gammaproteobacteria bacterium]
MRSEVGFVGIGQMGLPMVANLARAGYATVAYDVDSAAAAHAAALTGVNVVASPAEVAQRARVLFTCLPTADAVQAAYLDRDGVAHAGASGLITCDCSTTTPEVARSLHEELGSFGIHHLDAPILGTPQQAQKTQIFFAVSGEETQVANIAPYLRAMGRGYRYVGGPGLAHTVKILQNGLGHAYAAVTAEILALCQRLDMDIPTFIGVVKEARALGWSVYFDTYAAAAASGEDTGGGRLHISAKDTALVRDLASEARLPTPILQETALVFAEAMKAGWAGEEFTAVSRIAAQRGHGCDPEDRDGTENG